MKTKIILLVCFLFGSIVYAQPPHGQGGPGGSKEKREKIEAMKVEYFTSQLALTPEEAQKFWPVYNEFISKIHELEKKRRKALKKEQSNALSDATVNAEIKQMFDLEQEILDLKMAYDKKFKEVLPIQKVGKLYQAEQSFRHELLRKMKKGNGPPR